MSELNEMYNREHDQVAGTHYVSEVISTKQELIDISSSTIYVGNAYAGAATSALKSWMIEKIDLSTNPYVIKHATGAWDDRASLTYT